MINFKQKIKGSNGLPCRAPSSDIIGRSPNLEQNRNCKPRDKMNKFQEHECGLLEAYHLDEGC